ncbi:MAG: hypothetical protein ABI790_05310 [Betaproteobacteria bacterium]
MIDPLWTIDDIALYFQSSDDTAKRISVGGDFPKPIILPSFGKGARQMKRWLPGEIAAWAEAHKSPP